MLNEEQNDRFFESNTLYKKELKQKQRDILTSAQQSPTSNTNSTIQYKPSISSSVIESDLKSTTFNTFTQQQQLTSNQSETNILKSNSFSILSPNPNINTSNEHKNKKKSQHNSSNKVLNLFSHFLNRNKSSSPSQALSTNETNNNKSSENLNTKNSQETNYLNLKYLKRASSSSHFNKSHSNEHQINRKLSTSKLVSQNKISIISNSPLKEQTNNRNSEEKRPSIIITNEHDVKSNRRSYDDATLLNNSDLNNSSFNNNKFENTTFSTKNNGLIFIPSPKNCVDTKQARPVSCSSDINIQIESYNNYENLDQDLTESIANHLNEIDSKLPVQINIVNRTKKDDSGAFDNAVYSYVDNIRHHSKRLSDMFAQQLSATAATNAAAAVINSASSSSSSSSSSLSTKQTDQVEIPSNNLLIERPNSPTTLSCSSSFNNSNKQNENSFENQSYIRVNSMNKVKCGTKFNSGINLNSPASSLTSSSSNYSSNLSISPKSLSSSETIIINKNILNKPVPPLTPNSNVMSLREKFEQFHDSKTNLQTTPNSSMNRLNRNSAHIIQYKDMDTQQTIPIVYQSSLTSSLSIKNSIEHSPTPKLQQNLVISTTSIQTNQHINSPVSTMSSVSSLSDSSIKDSVSNVTSVPLVANNEFIAALSSSSSSSSSIDQCERCDEFDFNFFNDFYKQKFNKPNQFYSDYEQLCDLFIKNYYSNSFYIQHVLNPILNESNQQTELLICFKFTIDYLKQNIFSKFKIKPLDNDLNEYHCLEEVNLDIETSDCYKQLANLIPCKDLFNKNDPTNQFDSDKTKLKDSIRKKINYFAKQYNKTLKDIDLNNELGVKLLTQLEQDVNITSFELNKYKLLVNESDVINNLSLKLCNKLANTENSIQIIQLKQMQNINYSLMDSFNQETSSTSNLPELNEEIVINLINRVL